MRTYVIADETGRILGTIPAEVREAKPQPESEDTMRAEIVPEASPGRLVYEVELPSELEGIESPAELQQALEGYQVQTGQPALVRRR
jgi:hypothetical protein